MIISIFTEGSQTLVIPLTLIISQFENFKKEKNKNAKTNFFVGHQNFSLYVFLISIFYSLC